MLASRFVAPRRSWDAAAHPLSILAVLGLLTSSFVGRARGSLRWKGRAV